MNTKVGWLLLAVVTLLSCKQEHRISFVNPVPEDRSDEVVVLTREQVAEKVDIKEGLFTHI